MGPVAVAEADEDVDLVDVEPEVVLVDNWEVEEDPDADLVDDWEVEEDPDAEGELL